MSLSLTIIGVERVVVSVVVDRQLLIVDESTVIVVISASFSRLSLSIQFAYLQSDAMNWREKFEQSF